MPSPKACPSPALTPDPKDMTAPAPHAQAPLREAVCDPMVRAPKAGPRASRPPWPPDRSLRFLLARLLYGILGLLCWPFLLPLFGLHPRLRGGLGQRLGWLRAPDAHPLLLFHGSSAGDVKALSPLIRLLAERGHGGLLSCFSRSGAQMAQALFDGRVTCFRAPLDLEPVVARVLDRIRPRALVLEGLELWPALVSGCGRRGIPVAVVNGRLSSASLDFFSRFNAIFSPCLKSLVLVTTPSEEHARRFAAAGVPESRIRVLPSSKHAALVLRSPRPPGENHRLVLGSTHRTEEELLLPWLLRLLADEPRLRIVLAPRHPHRVPALRRRLESMGLSVGRWEPDEDRARVALLDRMGVLAEVYLGATLAFVGGSLIPLGGHNVMEPAAAGVPTCWGRGATGPETAQLLQEGGGFQVGDGEAFYQLARRLCRRPDEQMAASRAAQAVAARLQSAHLALGEALCTALHLEPARR